MFSGYLAIELRLCYQFLLLDNFGITLSISSSSLSRRMNWKQVMHNEDMTPEVELLDEVRRDDLWNVYSPQCSSTDSHLDCSNMIQVMGILTL